MSAPAPLREKPPEALRLATWNLHYIDLRAEEGRWSRAGWERRREAVQAAFEALAADLVALQEAESFAGGSVSPTNLALDFLLTRNPRWGAAATGDPERFPATQPILFRRARLEALDQGWFFFSETPETLYSRSFDGSWPAFASWARFRDRRSGETLRVVNAHFDHASRLNRRRSAALVAERVGRWIVEGERVALLGDLNARLGAEPVETLEAAELTFPDVPGATFHFDRGLHLFGAIDHVGLGPGLAPLGPPMVLRDRFDGVWPSDHHPVAMDVRLEGGG